MKLVEAIKTADEITPNNIPDKRKVDWLSAMDQTVKIQLIDTHEPGLAVPFEGYTPETTDRELLIPSPWANEVYIHLLRAYMYSEMGDLDQYNVQAALWTQAWHDYCNYYNRTHTPKSAGDWRF